MPFDFKKYDEKCLAMGPEELQKEWEHYTRLISGAATSTTVSGLALPFTAGVSVIGVGMAAPAIHNARKKREIIERHLQRHNTTHNTRAKDVLGSMAFSGTLGVLTLGVGTAGADAIAQSGAEHGISSIVNNDTAIKVGIHAALDGAAMAGEEAHHNHKKEKEAKKMIAAAQQKIAMAQAQGQYYPGQPMGEKAYGAVQIPGTYLTTAPPSVIPPPPQQNMVYPMPPASEIKYDIPPTPAYTPAPPAYPGMTSPPPQPVAPVPQYNPQNFQSPVPQSNMPMSPAPSVSTVSSYSSHPGQVFSPVSALAPTPAPQQVPVYTPSPSAPLDQPQAVAQNLPPFQSHVAAPGFQAPQPQLVWSHVHNQWIAQEVTPAQPTSAPVQQAQAPQEYGYPFPPQHAADRTESMYSSALTPAGPAPTSAPQQYASPPPSQAPQEASPPMQQPYTSPTNAPTYSSPPPQLNQAPTMTAYGYPTPAQTPGVSQLPSQAALYFPPPPGAQSGQPTPSYTPAPQYQTPAPQYAPVPTPQPHSAPHRHSIAQIPQQAAMTEQPASQYSGYQQPPRHYSLPTTTPIPGQEKLGHGWQPSVHHYSIPEHGAPMQQYYQPAPAAAAISVGGGGALPLYQPGVEGLCNAYGGMKI